MYRTPLLHALLSFYSVDVPDALPFPDWQAACAAPDVLTRKISYDRIAKEGRVGRAKGPELSGKENL